MWEPMGRTVREVSGRHVLIVRSTGVPGHPRASQHGRFRLVASWIRARAHQRGEDAVFAAKVA